jgi:hypothetical protein
VEARESLTPLKQEITNRGLVLGSTSFGEEIEKLTSCRVTKKKMGRPKKK